MMCRDVEGERCSVARGHPLKLTSKMYYLCSFCCKRMYLLDECRGTDFAQSPKEE